MTAREEPDPFDPATMCHPDPSIGGDPGGRCVHIDPCRLRCHTRYLDGQHQPNDWLFNGAHEVRNGAE